MSPEHEEAISQAALRVAQARQAALAAKLALKKAEAALARAFRDAERGPSAQQRGAWMAEKILETMRTSSRTRFTSEMLAREIEGARKDIVRNTLTRLADRRLIVRLSMGVYGLPAKAVAA